MSPPAVADKSHRGEKRRCTGCKTLFFDMQRSPVLCPNCGCPPGNAPARPKLKPAPVRVKTVRVYPPQVLPKPAPKEN